MATTWIKLHRKIKDNWLWQDAEKLKWWLDILITVNFKDNRSLIKGVMIDCARGQSTKSLDTWAMQWGTTKKTVSRFFQLLQKDGMVLIENLKVTTRITVCKYESYNIQVNGDDPADDTDTTRRRHADDPQYKKGNKGKKEKNEEDTTAEGEFASFENWILKNATNVSKMKEPFTEAQFENLVSEFNETDIAGILKEMHNYKKLVTGNVSANLTFRNWAKRRNIKNIADGGSAQMVY